MNVRLLGKLAVVGVVLFGVSACSRTPTQPSNNFTGIPGQEASGVLPSNSSGGVVGASSQICGDGSGQGPIDDMPADSGGSTVDCQAPPDSGDASSTASTADDQAQAAVEVDNGSMDSVRFSRRLRALHR